MDMSSFGSLKMSKNYLKEEVYNHIPLPLQIEDVVDSLVKAYKKFYGVSQEDYQLK